jgi:universal stress protein E
MQKIQSILFATDFRSSSDDALNATAKIATAFDSQVSVLHVMEPFLKGDVSGMWEHLTQSLLNPVKRRLEMQGVAIDHCHIRIGSIANSIVSESVERDVDLIVLGAGDKKTLGGYSLGPIAESVVTHASQPVLMVPPGSSNLAFKKILCPVDHSSTSARGLRNAVCFAKIFGSEIVVLSVVPEVSWIAAAVQTGELIGIKEQYANEWIQEFDQFMTGIDLSDVSWVKEVRHGIPHEQIVAAAKELGSDLIIMGASGRTGLLRVLLGSTTKRLLRELPCSLLTVKQDDLLDATFENDVRDIGANLQEAQVLLSSGNSVAAIVKYRLVLTLNPFHLAALEGLALAHAKLGETEDSERYSRRLESARRIAHPHLESTDVSF